MQSTAAAHAALAIRRKLNQHDGHLVAQRPQCQHLKHAAVLKLQDRPFIIKPEDSVTVTAVSPFSVPSSATCAPSSHVHQRSCTSRYIQWLQPPPTCRPSLRYSGISTSAEAAAASNVVCAPDLSRPRLDCSRDACRQTQQQRQQQRAVRQERRTIIAFEVRVSCCKWDRATMNCHLASAE
jgi:hypothetical protein